LGRVIVRSPPPLPFPIEIVAPEIEFSIAVDDVRRTPSAVVISMNPEERTSREARVMTCGERERVELQNEH
jgi:hypothetical protein